MPASNVLDNVEFEGGRDDNIRCGLACITIPTVLGVSVIDATYSVDAAAAEDFVDLVADEYEQVANPTIGALCI